MRVHLGKYSKIAFVLFTLMLSQCGKKSKSDDVTVTTSPSSPIVFLSDFPTNIAGTQTTIKAPWFEMKVNIDNQSTDSLIVMALHIEVTGIDASGAITVAKADLVPGTYNSTNTNGTVTTTCTYIDFGQFDSKTSGVLNIDYVNGSTNASSLCGQGEVLFYIGGNPTPANTQSVVYSVKVEPEGYFGTRDTPTDRFDGFGTIFTQ